VINHDMLQLHCNRRKLSLHFGPNRGTGAPDDHHTTHADDEAKKPAIFENIPTEQQVLLADKSAELLKQQHRSWSTSVGGRPSACACGFGRCVPGNWPAPTPHPRR
jgi:hypothetical protein